ncbi:hypothetical protein [Bordetella sp. FB-8]|uniref:hypothetical protein n=1 Tax=Bordetella sp. FB-8 TaxID=1159870 RepID=UPI000374CC3A|nr:hypothetical protein [Bordetella sp. FB-8]
MLAQRALLAHMAVRDVRDEVENLRQSTQAIAVGNQDMSARTQSQARSLEQAAAALDQVNGTVQSAAAPAGEGATLARDTRVVVDRGKEAVQNMVRAMMSINEALHRMGGIIAKAGRMPAACVPGVADPSSA